MASSTEKAFDSRSVRHRFCEAVQYGKLPCAYTKGLIVGDARVGKTSVRNTLLGKPNKKNNFHTDSYGIKQETLETYSDKDFFHKPGNNETEFTRAAAYIAVNGKNLLISKVNCLKFRDMDIFGLYIVGLVCLLALIFLDQAFNFIMTFILSIVLVLCMGYETSSVSQLYNYGKLVSLVCLILKSMCNGKSPLFVPGIDSITGSYKFTILAITMAIVVIGIILGMCLNFGLLSGVCFVFVLTSELQFSDFCCNLYDTESVIKLCVGSTVFAITKLILSKKMLQKQKKHANFQAFVLITFIIALAYKFLGEIIVCALICIVFASFIKLGEVVASTQQLIVKRDVTRTVQIFLGFEIGVILSQYLGFAPFLQFSVATFLQTVIAVLFFVGIEMCISHCFDEFPEKIFEELQMKGREQWPVKVCLLDCAGSQLYQDARHLFMGGRSIYMVVFNLCDAIEQHHYQLGRIIYWLNNIFAHTRHHDAKVILIGTNKALCSTKKIDEFAAWLYSKLDDDFSDCYALNKNRGNLPIFALDNVEFNINDVDNDLAELHSIIWNYANIDEFLQKDVPVHWFKFYDLLIKRRHLRKQALHLYGKTVTCGIYSEMKMNYDVMSRNHEDGNYGVISDLENIDGCITDIDTLYREVKILCKLRNKDEFHQMLQFYARYGEIFYRNSDPRLFQTVILEPQIIMDCVGCLAARYINRQDVPTYLQLHWHELEERGIASRDMLVCLLQVIPGATEEYIAILQALDLLIPMESQYGLVFGESDRYIVPFRLPSRVTSPRYDMTAHQFFFDFGKFNPQMIFLNLTAKCYQMSKFIAEWMEVEVSDNDWMNTMYKNCVEFYYGNQLHYSIELLQETSERNVFKVAVRRLHETASIFPLYSLLDGFVKSICRRDFPFLSYRAGVMCSCDEHLNVLAHHNSVEDTNIPKSGCIPFTCIKGDTVSVNIDIIDRIHQDQHIELAQQQEISTFGIHNAAFILCCADDRAWVQCELLPALQNIILPRKQHQFNTINCKILISHADSISKLNCDSRDKNREVIKASPCILAVLSKNYILDENSLLELRFAFQHCINNDKRLVPIIIDGYSCIERLPELNVIKPLLFPTDPNVDIFLKFFSPLMESITRAYG